MARLWYTTEEAEGLIVNKDACAGCRRIAAIEWLTRLQNADYRSQVALSPKIAFQANLLRNASDLPHTCKGQTT